ncbi:MAG: PEP-CTERM system histidine kinase PrsK [Chromatiales bacterium]|nr:PEP-CTERM system histidine kinase PrsK [Chromatiales bacterium]
MIATFFNPALWAGVMALVYALVGAYVLLAPGSVLVRTQLLGVLLASVLWGVLVAQPGLFDLSHGFPPGFYGLQVVHLFSWYALIHRLLRGPYEQSMPEVVKRLLRLFWLVVLGASGLVAWLASREDMPWQGTLFSVSAASIALVSLALAAQVGRDAPIEGRTALRSLVAAAGLATGAQSALAVVAAAGAGVPRALLGGTGAVLAISGLLLLFGLRLRPQWSLAIFVSPEARSYAPRFLGALSILLLALLLLPVFRSMPPAAAQQGALLLALVTGVPIGFMLFSERLNARLRVYVSKHFLPFRYDYREEWLRLIDTLVSPDATSPLPERVIRGVAQIVGSPAGVLWMRSGDGGAFTATAGWNTRTLPEERILPDDPALVFMLERQWTIDTAELARRPELYGGLGRPEWLASFPEGLLIVPLISNEALIGLIVLFQSSSAFRLTFEEIDLLRTSGRQVAAFLAQYEADQRLAEGRQFEAFNRLTAFVMHDLKNLIAQQSLMVQNAARHKGNPAFFEDAMATIDNSVARMNKLLQQLQSGDTIGPRQRVRVVAAVTDAVERCRSREPVPELVDDSDDLHVWIDRERLTSVLAHLIRNAQEATTREGHVTVRVSEADNGALIEIADDGCGMAPEFVRDRLFRPFDTTKGSKGMGIGAYQARMFVVEAGGSLRVESEPGQGTRFFVRLPVQDPGSGIPAP